ncbi:MAG: ribonuclease J [Bacillota bacterium]|nr:ribonuclease J [Bacillota bacterium]
MAVRKSVVSENEKVRVFALGGLDEDGKNMYVVEAGQDIYVIEAGIKFPETKESLGIECIVPDFSYLIENKSRIAGIFITHGHDDVMGGLTYLLKQINADIYSSPFTAKIISRLLRKEKITGSHVHTLHEDKPICVGSHKIEVFPITHDYPGTYGIAIETGQGYVVYSGEFIQDSDSLSEYYRGDYIKCAEIGNKGVFILLQESKGVERNGYTAPAHRIGPSMATLLEKNEDRRIFVSAYTQNVFWLQEILRTCVKFGRKMILYTDDLKEMVRDLQSFGFEVGDEHFLPTSMISEVKDVIVIIGGQGKAVFQLMSNISNNEVSNVHFTNEDIICIASPVLPGIEKEFKQMENDVYKNDGEIVNLYMNAIRMHPSKFDLKLMISLMNPKYYIPVKGAYRHLYMNGELAMDVGFKPSNIVLLDNGQVATFENKKLKSCSMELELHDSLIDGKENWDMAGVVLKDRETLSTDGVMILAIGIDSFTKKIINGPDVQTRGLIYLKDAEYITTDVAKIMEETIEEAVKNGSYENLTTRQEIREKVSRYLIKTIAKKPMILPVILEINTNNIV